MSITSAGLQQLGFKSLNIDPAGDFKLQDDGAGVYIKEWASASPQPSEAEIETAHAEWQAEQDANAYRAERAKAYPAIGDQLDALFKHLNYRRTQGDALVQDLDDVIGEWLSVKAAYPKPE